MSDPYHRGVHTPRSPDRRVSLLWREFSDRAVGFQLLEVLFVLLLELRQWLINQFAECLERIGLALEIADIFVHCRGAEQAPIQQQVMCNGPAREVVAVGIL